jgi:FkbM family methyltransferase
MNFSGISPDTLIGKLLRLPLRLVPRGLVVRILQGPLKGKRWIAGSSINGWWLGSWEQDKQIMFTKIISPGDIVFDVGAHVGFYTLLAAELVGPTGRVVAFEPVPRNLEILKRHIQLNGYTNVTIIEAAVSNSSGFVSFDAQPGQDSAGHISDKGCLQVSTIVLDELVGNKLPVPSVIKIDIEGAEYLALSGSKKILGTHHPVILLATHGSEVHDQCCNLLSNSGYSLHALDHRPLEQTDEIIAKYI